MAPKKSKKGLPWPEPRCKDDPDIRAYAATLLRDIEALEKHQKEVDASVPRDLLLRVFGLVASFARRVKEVPTNKALAQCLARVELHVEKTQKEVSQAFREILNTKSNTNRLVEALCGHPTPPGSRIAKSLQPSHVTGSSESYVSAWGRNVPSHLSTVPSARVSSGGSVPRAPIPSQEDLEVYLECTDPEIVNPLR